MMKKLDVHYNGWSENWKLGTIATNGKATIFEYSPGAIERRLELAPFCTPLSKAGRANGPYHMDLLPGLISDSMPDGWGMTLINRLRRQQGLSRPDALDVLSFVGSQAIGALSFSPATPRAHAQPLTCLTEIAEHAAQILEGDAVDVLPALVHAGGSPHGARPKAMVTLRPDRTYSTDFTGAGEQWLVKFASPADGADAPCLEAMYAYWAGLAGIAISRSKAIPLGNGTFAFGTERFDRRQGMRMPVFTLASLAEADFRTPGVMSYEQLLKVTITLTRDMSQLAEMFARCVFNVVFCNLDDHPKNFAFMLDATDNWSCAPAYDLTYSSGPGGEHNMDIAGKGADITRSDLLALARLVGLDVRRACEMIDRVATTASEALRTSASLEDMEIRPVIIRAWSRSVATSLARMTR